MDTRSSPSDANSQNWLLGVPPCPVPGFTGKRLSISPDPSLRRQSVLRASSLGSPPELKARSLSTSLPPGPSPGPAAGPGAPPNAGPGSHRPLGTVDLGSSPSRQVGRFPATTPRWSLLSSSMTGKEAEQIRQYLGYDSAMAPRLQDLLKRHIVPGRNPAEAQADAAMELQELLYAECPEEMDQLLAAHVKLMSNPFLPNLDSSEPSARRPRFNLLWIQALRDPKTALEVAARWMFAGRSIAEYGDGRVRDMFEQLCSMNNKLRFGQCRISLPHGALKGLRDDDHDFYSVDRMTAWGSQEPAVENSTQDPARPVDGVEAAGGRGVQVSCALIYTECIGSVKMVDEEPRIQQPESLRLLPQALLPRIDSFLQLRGLPALAQPGCYGAYVSPGTANTTIHSASTWQETKNATVVIQRKEAAPFVCATRFHQDLCQMNDKLTKWIPLFRAYLGEYADLLGTFMMETPPHVSYAPVCDAVNRDFWPHRVLPDASTLQSFWGERDHNFHMNFALLTSFLAHTSKLTVAMDELDTRWEDVVTGAEALQEREYRELMSQMAALTNEVETLLCKVADVEFEQARLGAISAKGASLQAEKERLQGKMAVVDPPLCRIWSRKVLDDARTKIAHELHKNDILLDMKLSMDCKHRIQGWKKWLPAILASPDAKNFLEHEDLSRETMQLTATDDYDYTNQPTLQFQANKDAHQLSHPWIAEAIRCPELNFMREELEAWFRYVYNRVDEDIESSRKTFVPEFDPPTDHQNYFLAE